MPRKQQTETPPAPKFIPASAKDWGEGDVNKIIAAKDAAAIEITNSYRSVALERAQFVAGLGLDQATLRATYDMAREGYRISLGKRAFAARGHDSATFLEARNNEAHPQHKDAQTAWKGTGPVAAEIALGLKALADGVTFAALKFLLTAEKPWSFIKTAVRKAADAANPNAGTKRGRKPGGSTSMFRQDIAQARIKEFRLRAPEWAVPEMVTECVDYMSALLRQKHGLDGAKLADRFTTQVDTIIGEYEVMRGLRRTRVTLQEKEAIEAQAKGRAAAADAAGVQADNVRQPEAQSETLEERLARVAQEAVSAYLKATEEKNNKGAKKVA